MIGRNSLTLITIVGALSIATQLAGAQPATEAGRLRVGLATVDITPDGPVYMAGYGAAYRAVQGHLRADIRLLRGVR
jgi:hypothetical protein